MVVPDVISQRELGQRWAYRAGLEHAAARRFDWLAACLREAGFADSLVAIARESAAQERVHVRLCSDIAVRFDATVELEEGGAIETAPPSLSLHQRTLYEVVAVCCIAETANAAVVAVGADDIVDPEIRRAVRTILADEVQHSRLGWHLLASCDLSRADLGMLGGFVPHMLRGTVRDDLFAAQSVRGDEAVMATFGTLPLEGRRATFLAAMREVALPGLAYHGVDTTLAATFLDQLAAVETEGLRA